MGTSILPLSIHIGLTRRTFCAHSLEYQVSLAIDFSSKGAYCNWTQQSISIGLTRSYYLEYTKYLNLDDKKHHIYAGNDACYDRGGTFRVTWFLNDLRHSLA